MNKLPLAKRVQILSMLCEGMSMLNAWATRDTTSWAGAGRALAAPIPAQNPTSPTAPTPTLMDARRHQVLSVSREAGALLRWAMVPSASVGSPSESSAASSRPT